MVKITPAGNFLRPANVKEGDILEIMGEGQNRTAQETPFGRAVFQLPVKLPDGAIMDYTVNRTTQKELSQVWGDETKNWVGKKIRVSLVKQNVRGELKDVIYGHPAG